MTPPEKEVRAVQAQRPALATLVVGLLLGASLGPALFLAVDRLELSGDVLLSFAIGAFLTLGVCVTLLVVAAFLILPRMLAGARGTLTGVVDDLTRASRAHAQGDTDKALDHLGRAIGEGTAWYSIGATRRFAAQAALGLLISFGGSIGAVLLFTQNSLLRDQNSKIDKQIVLLTDQNNIADAQKRGAFVTEMFSILQEVAKVDRSGGELPKELVTRITVLTGSAVPYSYQSRAGVNQKPELVVLSPERGQMLLALARMNVKLLPLIKAGAQFYGADLRGLDLRDVDFTEMELSSCDLSFSVLSGTQFVKARLTSVVLKRALLQTANFSGAIIAITEFENSVLDKANFDGAELNWVKFKGSSVGMTSFENAQVRDLRFERVSVARLGPMADGLSGSLPKGLPWPDSIVKGFETTREGDVFNLSHTFINYNTSYQTK